MLHSENSEQVLLSRQGDVGATSAKPNSASGKNDPHQQAIRHQIEEGLRSSEPEVIELEGGLELLLGKNDDGLRLELFQKGDDKPLWSRQYSRLKCAVKGALRVIETKVGSGAVTNVPATAVSNDNVGLVPANPDANPAEVHSIWQKVPVGYKDVTTISGNGTEVAITVVPSGLGSSLVELTWEGRRMVREYETDWQAKFEALKMANRLVEWAN